MFTEYILVWNWNSTVRQLELPLSYNSAATSYRMILLLTVLFDNLLNHQKWQSQNETKEKAGY